MERRESHYPFEVEYYHGEGIGDNLLVTFVADADSDYRVAPGNGH